MQSWQVFFLPHRVFADKQKSSWQKTSLWKLTDEGLFVIKQQLKVDASNFQCLKDKLQYQHNSIQSEIKHPNLLGFFKESPAKINQDLKSQTILLRQYVTFNLIEKLELLPQQLNEIEKYWLIFQILCGLEQLHSIPQMAHGDLKPDNILVTSFDWVFIADINPLKPVQALDTDLKTYNLYFGDLDNNNRCYLAPERWITPPQTIDENAVLHPSMDIFSAGCIIAEILSDGQPLFDLPKLQQYRHQSDTFKPEGELQRRGLDPILIKLIRQMLDLDPTNRPTATQCMKRWNEFIFPESFHTVFFQICSQFQRPQNFYADSRLSVIRFYADAIFFKCFNIKDGSRSQGLTVPIDQQTFRLFQLDSLTESNKQLVPSHFKFCNRNMLTNNQDWETEEDNWAKLNLNQQQLNKESALIIINWIGSQLNVCFNQLDKLAALEMIQKLAKFQSFDVRLNRILPYIHQAFGLDSQEGQKNVNNKESTSQSEVRVKALEVLLSMFEDVLEDSSKVTMQPSEYKVFQNYIFPLIKRLFETTKFTEYGHQSSTQNLIREETTVRHAVANNLGLIAKVGMRCIEIAQASFIQLREELRQKKLESFKIQQETQAQANDAAAERSSIYQGSRRTQSVSEEFVAQTMFLRKQTLVMKAKAKGKTVKDKKQLQTVDEEEGVSITNITTDDIQAPNYDAEVESFSTGIKEIIQEFWQQNQDSNLVIAMLANLVEISKSFDVYMSDFIIQICFSAMNMKDSRITIQALKTLMKISFRYGQKKVEDNILPGAYEDKVGLIFDPDDLVVIQTLKMINRLVTLRLVSQKKSEEILKALLPFFIHPNKQIRYHVTKYVQILATLGNNSVVNSQEVLGQEESQEDKIAKRINQKKGPLFTQMEFYIRIRPKILSIFQEQYEGSSEITQITSVRDIQLKLRPPLSLKVYLKCLKDKSEMNQSHSKEDDWAIGILRTMIERKSDKIGQRQRNEQKRQVESFALQKYQRAKQYRVIKANSIAQLVSSEIFDTFKHLEIKDEKEPSQIQNIVAQQHKQLMFEPNTLVTHESRESLNFGLNFKSADQVREVDHMMTPEMQNIVDSLELHKDKSQIKYIVPAIQLNNNLAPQKSLKVDQELCLSALGAQPSVLPHFEGLEMEHIQMIKVSDEHRRKGKAPQLFQQQQKFQGFQGTLVSTLYEHEKPVNTVAVSDDNQFFLTGSREDKKVYIWSVKDVEEDKTSGPVQSITSEHLVNQVSVLSNSEAIAVASSGGVQIYDLTRTFENSRRENKKDQRIKSTECISNIGLNDQNDEINSIVNMILPVANKQHILCCATQKGGLFLYDLRVQKNQFFENDVFSKTRGSVSAMTVGYEPYQLTVGTLGGYVMVYDIRYNLSTAIYRHNMNYPILALATSKIQILKDPKDPKTIFIDEKTLVSAGGPTFELSHLNLLTGSVETLFRCSDSNSKVGFEGLRKNDIMTVPEFFKETNFRDAQLGTLRRESYFKQFNRSMMSVFNHEQFEKLMEQTESIKNIDSQFLNASQSRYKLIHDANISPNACRTILVPRNTSQSLFFDGQTAGYAITGGNDKKIRYWSLTQPDLQSMIINSPNDEEVAYSRDLITKETKVIQERPVAVKEFPILTQLRLKENQGANQSQYLPIDNQNFQVKYPGNTFYHNIVANIIATATAQQVGYGRENGAAKATEKLFQHLQYEQDDKTILVNNLNGLSNSQYLNDLTLYANGSSEITLSQTSNLPTNELLNEKIIRSSDIVSHTDTILDLAQIEFSSDYGKIPLLVSVSRDCTVKIWK